MDEQASEKGQSRGMPNILVGAHAHVSIKVSATIYNVELREVGIYAGSGYNLDVSLVQVLLDSHTSETSPI